MAKVSQDRVREKSIMLLEKGNDISTLFNDISPPFNFNRAKRARRMDPSSNDNYKRLSVTRLFLSYPSPLLSPSFHLFLGVTLVIETLHSKEILASFRRNEARFQNSDNSGEEGAPPFDKERAERFDPFFFFFPPSPFRSILTFEGANSCIWAWQIGARDPLMMRTNEPRVARGGEKKD